jgi:hypothetical protein
VNAPETTRPDLRTFFEGFNSRDGADVSASADLFYEQFLSLDPNSVTHVTREQLRSVLPMRAKMFESIGAIGNRLRDLDAQPVDDQHVLVRTTWDVVLSDEEAEPFAMHSTYLLRLVDGEWQVLVYLNHQDIGSIIAERRAALGR